MAAIFRAAVRVLRPDGTLWLNLGDTYPSRANPGRESTGIPSGGTIQASHRARVNTTRTARPKSLLLTPPTVALALQADGWIVRNDIVWHKPNAMPETVTDRLASRYEHLYLLTGQPRYSFDIDAIRALPDHAASITHVQNATHGRRTHAPRPSPKGGRRRQ